MTRLILLVAAIAVCSNAYVYVKDEEITADIYPEEIDLDEDSETQDDKIEQPLDNTYEEGENEEKTWLNFSKSNVLSVAVEMKDIERYYVKFPCSEKAQRIEFTLHFIGENEMNSYITFRSRKNGQIVCNKGGKQNFKIPDTETESNWQCEDDGVSMIVEVEKNQQYLAIKNKKNTIYYFQYSELADSNVGDCDKETKRIMANVGDYWQKVGNKRFKYHGPFSLAFSTVSTGWREYGLKIDLLKQEIQMMFAKKSPSQIKSYVKSTEGAMKIFQWWLLNSINDNTDKNKKVINLDDEVIGWILNNREALEMFMTSGDVRNNRYWEALMIFRKLTLQDPDIKNDPLRLRLAVAISLTHSTPVKSLAVSIQKDGLYRDKYIDWMETYQSYLKWHKEGVLFPQFEKATAWHLRYVVGSITTKEEQIWARENTPKKKKKPNKIGNGLGMIKHRGKNLDGQPLGGKDNREKFYYYQPVTLLKQHEIGGICGAISKFNTGMCQAFGVPASPVRQPLHMAYIWWTEKGEWVLRYSVKNWGGTMNQRAIQFPWGRSAYFIPLMNEAQKNLAGYRLSEKMRIAGMLANPKDRFEILEDATTECPYNFAAWKGLEDAMKEESLQKSDVQNVLLPIVVAQRRKDTGNQISNIAAEKKVSSDFLKTASFITGPTNDAGCRFSTSLNETGSFEIDLDGIFSIKAVNFKHVRSSKPIEYDIFAMSIDGEYTLVKTEKQEQKTEDQWTYLDGWDMKTTRIKMDLKRSGGVSEYRYDTGKINYGIVHFRVDGLPLPRDVSKGKPIMSNPDSTNPESLVDGNNSTSWEGNNEYSWFEINLKQICALDDIEILWADDVRPERVNILYKVGSGRETKNPATAPFYKIPLQGEFGTTVKVEMFGGGPVLKGVKACGIDYSTKSILKMKLYNSLQDFYYVRREVQDSIDRMEFED